MSREKSRIAVTGYRRAIQTRGQKMDPVFMAALQYLSGKTETAQELDFKALINQ